MAVYVERFYNNFSRFAFYVISITSTVTLLGWVFGLNDFKEILYGVEPMHPLTCILFILSAGGLLCIKKSTKICRKISYVSSLVVVSTVIVTLIFEILNSQQVYIDNNLKKFFYIENVPSLESDVNFLLFALALILSKTKLISDFARFIGFFIAFTGLDALVGHFADIPALYYYIPNLSSQMSIIAGILFLILGMSLVINNIDSCVCQ